MRTRTIILGVAFLSLYCVGLTVAKESNWIIQHPMPVAESNWAFNARAGCSDWMVVDVCFPSRNLDGVSDNISLGSATILDDISANGAAFTYAIWIKPATVWTNAVAQLFSKGNSGSARFGFYASETNMRLVFERSHGSVLGVWVTDDSSIVNDQWQHVAMSKVQGTGTDPQFYINGAAANTTEVSTPSGTPTGNESLNLVLGGLTATTSQEFTGRMAYAHVYNVILTEAEIRQIMQYPGSVRRGLIAYLPLGAATPEPDDSGNGNNGTPAGTTIVQDEPPIN